MGSKVGRERSHDTPERVSYWLRSLELNRGFVDVEPWDVGLDGRFADTLKAGECGKAHLVGVPAVVGRLENSGGSCKRHTTLAACTRSHSYPERCGRRSDPDPTNHRHQRPPPNIRG